MSASLAEIKATGAAGMFAVNPQTLARMRTATFMPEPADRQLRQRWQLEGASTIHWDGFLPISDYRVVSMALKLTDTRSRSLSFLGTLWGSHAGKMIIVPSSPLKMICGLVIGSISPGNGLGL